MFGFLKKDKSKEEKIIELNVDGVVDCIGDFTYNFYWSHKGEKMELNDLIQGTEYSFKDINDYLQKGYSIKINGDAGHRLASSLGVNLKYFGGDGSSVNVGNIIVEGNVKSRMGISAVKGNIYVKGDITGPIGNLVEIKSDKKDYRKFRSITDIIMNGLNKDKLIGAELHGNTLTINDEMVRDTVGARINKNCEIIVNNDVDLSTGVLMRKGRVIVNGKSGKNTAALLNGATIIINGNCDDFTAADMIKGNLIVNGNAGNFLAANKKTGTIYAKKGSAIFPTKEQKLDMDDKNFLIKNGFNYKGFKKFF